VKNILFICSANKDRSKTAEDHFSERYPDMLFDAAGTNQKMCRQYGTTFLEETQLEWADKVFVMEQKHHRAIKELYGSNYSHKITVLNIPDRFKYGSKELVEILEDKVKFKV